MLRYLPIALALSVSICIGFFFSPDLMVILLFSATVSATVALALLIRFALGNKLYSKIKEDA